MNESKRHLLPAAVPHSGAGRSYFQTGLLILATAIGMLLCVLLAMPFLSAVVWAVALAVVFMPFHGWLESKFKRKNVSALLSVLVVAVIVVVPAVFTGQQLVQQAAKGAQRVTVAVESGAWRHSFDSRPRLARLTLRIEQQVDLAKTVQTLAAWLTNTAKSIVKGSVVQGVSFLLIFYLLFFFFRDRRMALQAIRSLSPLTKAEMDHMLVRIGDTICATIYGTLTVAAVQGLLGGLMFWCLGLSAPLLWGVLMAILAIVPVLGAFVVWIPATVFLALNGSWGKAMVLAIWGAAVVSTVDNLLRPMLIGNRLKLHTVLAFMSMLGGIILFGSAGLVLGPVVLTITTVLIQLWQKRTEPEDVADSHGT